MNRKNDMNAIKNMACSNASSAFDQRHDFAYERCPANWSYLQNAIDTIGEFNIARGTDDYFEAVEVVVEEFTKAWRSEWVLAEAHGELKHGADVERRAYEAIGYTAEAVGLTSDGIVWNVGNAYHPARPIVSPWDLSEDKRKAILLAGV